MAIAKMLGDGRTWREVMDATACSRTLLAKIVRDVKARPGEPSV